MAYTVCELAKLALASYDAIPSKVDDWEPMRTFGVHERHGFFGVLFRRESLFVMAYRGTDDWQVDLFDDSAILAGKVSAQMHEARIAMHESKSRLARGVGKLVLTGHSLGGGLAALIAAESGLHAATFNAPGMMISYGANFVALGPAIARFPVIAQMLQITAPYAVYTDRILNLRANGDLVSVATGPQLGKVKSISVRGCEPVTGPKPVGGPMPAGLVGALTRAAEARSPETAFGASVVAGAQFVLCQHGMARMLNELQYRSDYAKDLGW